MSMGGYKKQHDERYKLYIYIYIIDKHVKNKIINRYYLTTVHEHET